MTGKKEKSGLKNEAYLCWLSYRPIKDPTVSGEYRESFSRMTVFGKPALLKTAIAELQTGMAAMLGFEPRILQIVSGSFCIAFGSENYADITKMNKQEILGDEGYIIGRENGITFIDAKTDRGLLYGVFALLRLIQAQAIRGDFRLVENPVNRLRMINHWDNMDGGIERGYAGKSIFFGNNAFIRDGARIRDYARLLASAGINGVSINNVNVHSRETLLITSEFLPDAARVAAIFREYGIKLFLSINYSSPIELGGLTTADPLDEGVQRWWCGKAKEIYDSVPDFGGFVVKADSEFRPGPFTYGRNHADGANMLARALEPHGGIVVWRCFVYNCRQDWRDRATDRANAAYDHFMPLDGQFMDNVVLQIKNGPMDFQVREPVSPLFGGLCKTNQMLELQITQEYTGQQKHICYLVPQWKEILDFDTYAKGKDSTVKKIVSGQIVPQKYSGFAAVSNIGDDPNWTGHLLAQANLYGYGRLAWNPELTARQITEEWVRLTFSDLPDVVGTLSGMLLRSWEVYEKYTSPLGIGWMINPGHHYGPSPDGYEYSAWGTYHRADCLGIGVDRSVKAGTGYAGRYFKENAAVYENIETCPEPLLLFFHHVPYAYRLKSGKTLIQHIYDTHFEGVEEVRRFMEQWVSLKGHIDAGLFEQVLERLDVQLKDSMEWRDVINSYFFRKSGIPDEQGRKIY